MFGDEDPEDAYHPDDTLAVKMAVLLRVVLSAISEAPGPRRELRLKWVRDRLGSP